MSETQDPRRSARVDAIVDEFVARYHRSDPVSAEDLVNANPDIAEALAERLAAAERMLGMADPTCPADEDREHTPHSREEADDRTPPPLGLVIEGYELKGMIHHGGQGVVYRAVRRSTRREVAIKLLLGGSFASAVNRKRFEREIDLAAKLRHPNIVTVFDSGTTRDEAPFYVMDYVDGLPLHLHIRAELSVEAVLSLFLTVCRAVSHAHQHAVIHRDLKPANILVDRDGSPKVLDFGLAKATAGDRQTTVSMTGQVIGTLPYMSPEQARGSGELDVRTDVYALGIILYEILTGHYPYAVDGHPTQILESIVQTPPTAPSRAWSGDAGVPSRFAKHRSRKGRCPIDHELDTIVLKALAKEPARRYQSAAAFADDVARYLQGLPVEAKRDSRMYVLRKTIGRYKAAVAVTAAGVLLISVFALAMTVSYFRAEGQRLLAEQKTLEAQRAEALAESERNRADQRAAELRRNMYFHAIALAQHAGDENNVTQLKKLLRDCPEDLRGWEWRRLWWLSDTSIATLRGHESSVMCVAFFPDGRRIASGSRDGTARIWDAHTGDELLALRGTEGTIETLAVAPDGGLVASGGHSASIRIWNAATGEPVHVITGHDGSVTAIAFSPEGRRVISGDQHGWIKVWDVVSGELILTLHGHTAAVHCVACSPDGRMIVSGSDDRTIRFWDSADGADVSVLRGHTDDVTALAFSPDGARLVSSGWDRTVRLWDVTTGEQIWSLDHADANVSSVAFHPDGTYITSASYRSIRLWDAATGEVANQWMGHEFGTMAVAFGPGGRRLVSGGHDSTIKLWDASSEPEPCVLRGSTHFVDSVAVSPDGTRIASGARDGTITIWDAGAHLPTATWTGHEPGVTALSFAPDGGRLASGGADHRVRIWDVATGTEMLTLSGHGDRVVTVAYSPDGERLVSAGYDRTVRLWDARTGEPRGTPWVHVQGVVCAVFSPDGERVATGGWDRMVRVWRVGTDAEEQVLKGHAAPVNAVAFSPDGKLILSAASDATARVWDADSGATLHILEGHENAVMSAAFSPDGQRIATAGFDSDLILWDTRSGRLALTLRGHEGPVGCVAFSPNGLWLVSGSADKTVRIWNAPRPGP